MLTSDIKFQYQNPSFQTVNVGLKVKIDLFMVSNGILFDQIFAKFQYLQTVVVHPLV